MSNAAAILYLIFVTAMCVIAMTIPLAFIYVLVKGSWLVLHAVWVHPWL